MIRGIAVWLLAWAIVPIAHAGGFVVWMESDIPDEKQLKRAQALSGASGHLAHVDLAFAPQPATDEDALRFEQLREAVAAGKAKWDDFDVELGIARDLEGILSTITVIRDLRDLQDVVDSRLFQGAAVLKAFDQETFLTDAEAEPFRVDMPGFAGNRPWALAMALAPDREFTRADVADGSAFPDLQALQQAFSSVPSGKIDTSGLPKGTRLFVDGREIVDGDATVRPGTHFSHVLRNEIVSGRQVFDVAAGETITFPMLVESAELEQARAQILSGVTTGFPEDVKAALDAVSTLRKGAVFVGAVDERGRVVILPYARGATLTKQRWGTFVLSGEIGGAGIVSRMMDESLEKNVTAPAIHGQLGFEIGIYNFALIGGSDLAITPGNTVKYGPGDNADTQKNVNTSTMPQPWGGLGAYILRPAGRNPTMLVAGTYGWLFPAHLAFGGRISFGIPMDDKTWFRITVGGSGASSPIERWRALDDYSDVAMFTLFTRVGLATRF